MVHAGYSGRGRGTLGPYPFPAILRRVPDQRREIELVHRCRLVVLQCAAGHEHAAIGADRGRRPVQAERHRIDRRHDRHGTIDVDDGGGSEAVAAARAIDGPTTDPQDLARPVHGLARRHAARSGHRADGRQRAVAGGVHVVHRLIGDPEDPTVRGHEVPRVPPEEGGRVHIPQQSERAVDAADLGPVGAVLTTLDVHLTVRQRSGSCVPPFAKHVVKVGLKDIALQEKRPVVAGIGGRRSGPVVAAEQRDIAALR